MQQPNVLFSPAGTDRTTRNRGRMFPPNWALRVRRPGMADDFCRYNYTKRATRPGPWDVNNREQAQLSLFGHLIPWHKNGWPISAYESQSPGQKNPALSPVQRMKRVGYSGCLDPFTATLGA